MQRTQGLIALDCFPGAEISGFIFRLCFLPSLLRSPKSSGGHQASQKPVRAAEGPSADLEAARCCPQQDGSQQASQGADSTLAGLRLLHFPQQKQVRSLYTCSVNMQANKHSDKECIAHYCKKGLVLGHPLGLGNPPVVANQCKPEALQFEGTISRGGEACKEIPISR